MGVVEFDFKVIEKFFGHLGVSQQVSPGCFGSEEIDGIADVLSGGVQPGLDVLSLVGGLHAQTLLLSFHHWKTSGTHLSN